ncbi:signal peptidase II [Candidatus Woesearchaeota archaeon]|nr:signal peptidase II [Candidatus Woesearchaeota archaeon]|tara:strand:+ start:2794 stop:3267 length:474 start_codon:yes stop_codon:yes gene_type:complete
MVIKSFFWWLIGLVVFFDQLSKWVVVWGFGFDWGWFSVHLVENTGAGFGIFRGSNVYLLVISLLIVGCILFFWKKFDLVERFFLVLVIGGAAGNSIDRVVHGFVVDFLDSQVWSVFNLADSVICVSVVGLVLYTFREKSVWLEGRFVLLDGWLKKRV